MYKDVRHFHACDGTAGLNKNNTVVKIVDPGHS